MLVFQWSEEFRIGIDEIDRQHQDLFVVMNQLSQAMAQGTSWAILSELVSKLIKYSKVHFACEEALMKRYGYPECEAHVKEHSEFINKMTRFSAEEQAQKLDVPIRLLDYLSDWLTNHFLKTDALYASYIKEKGIESPVCTGSA